MNTKETEPRYLGDGVYAQVDSGMIALTTGADLGNPHDNVVYLEPEVIVALEAYIKLARENGSI